MWKNLLTLLISTTMCAAALWWAAPLLLPKADTLLPSYDKLIEYDPNRKGGHLKPGINQLVQGERRGQGVSWITNSAGFRNTHEVELQAAEGVLRILFYGDSFVDGLGTDQENTIGAVLQRELERELGQDVEVIISGHNNPANAWYHWQTHGHQYNPNVVILGLTVGNDLTWHNFGAGVLPTVKDFDNLVELDPTSSQAGVSDCHSMIPADGFVPPGQRSSWDVFTEGLNQTLANRFFFLSHRARPAMEPNSGSPGQVLAADFYVSLGLYYKGSIPFIESAWRDYETLLTGFSGQVRYFGARPVMVLFPTRIEALPGDWKRLVNELELNPVRFNLLIPSQRLAELCEHIALPCLDTAPALRKGHEDGEVFKPLGDMHLNDHGQAATALAIADFIGKVLQTDEPPSPTDDWLDKYRLTIRQWASLALEEDTCSRDP